MRDAEDLEEYEPDLSELPDDECCICGSYSANFRASYGYLFCSEHVYRGVFIDRGKEYHWPALRIQTDTAVYAIDHDQEAWLFNAFCATDERIVALLEALDTYEKNQPRDAA